MHLAFDTDHHSVHDRGGLPDAAGYISTLLGIGCFVWIVSRFARGTASPSRLATACAAAVTGFVTFDKVLSPQYLIWLVPLVTLVGGRKGVTALLLLVSALLLTQSWYPSAY